MLDTQTVLLIAGVVFLSYFIFTSRSYYSDDHPILNKVRENFAKLNPEYANIPLRKGGSSYTENKKLIVLCLSDPVTGKYYSMNTIMHVALHELGHAISKTHGHNDEFNQNFKLLLQRAAELGIYDPYQPIPSTYCGLKG